MPSKSTMVYSNKHDENHPFSYKKLAQYINAITSSQYEAMAKFYTENGPPGGKTWPEYLQFINDDLEGHGIEFNISSVEAALEGYLIAAAKKGGHGDAKPDDDIYTLSDEARQHLDDK